MGSKYLVVRYPGYWKGHYNLEVIHGIDANAYARAHGRVLMLAKRGCTDISIQERNDESEYKLMDLDEMERREAAALEKDGA